MNRRFFTLAPLLAALALIAPSTAGAAIVHAQSGALGLGREFDWSLDYDSVAKTVTLNATYTSRSTGQPLADSDSDCVVVLVQPNGVQRPFNFNSLTVTLGSEDGLPNGTVVTPLNAQSDGQPGILNKGAQTYNVPTGLRVSANRAAAIDFLTVFKPGIRAS